MANHDRISWDTLFIASAYLVGMRSADPSTQVGAVIIGPDNVQRSGGYNGWPRGVAPFEADDPRWQRPEKYHWMEHAEKNAIINAGRLGIPVEGCTLYSYVYPCSNCARSIVGAGIVRVVIHAAGAEFFAQHQHGAQTWAQDLAIARDILAKGNVKLDLVHEDVPALKVRLCSEVFHCETRSEIRPALGKLTVSADKITHHDTP